MASMQHEDLLLANSMAEETSKLTRAKNLIQGHCSEYHFYFLYYNDLNNNITSIIKNDTITNYKMQLCIHPLKILFPFQRISGN